jgi:hypothetical protein
MMVAAAVVTIAVPAATTAVNAQTRPATIRHTQGATTRQVDIDTLRVLDQLHRFGYTINTPARATRAIRHWQHANGLTVDGIVGPEVLTSLGLDRLPPTASVPAVRLDPPPAPAADPEQIIRDVWPDDLEDHAIAIATRESRLQPSARNACCWGLFQINWQAHHAWLAEIGVTSASQLLDPSTNTQAALALYQRDGWRPWTL